MASNKRFWDKQKEHSQVKSEIVAGYFGAYAGIMASRGGVTYLDMFSGRGEYNDGTASTPLLILDKIAESPSVQRSCNLIFCEEDLDHFANLQKCVGSHRACSLMATKPQILNRTIAPSIISELKLSKNTFAFIDPYGLKGLSYSLLAQIIFGVRNDCVFLLSTSSIRRNLKNQRFQSEIETMVGTDGLHELMTTQQSTTTFQFDRIVIKAVERVLSKVYTPLYFIPFEIQFENRKMSSHYLIFVSKHHLGFRIMKAVMAKPSDKDDDLIPSYRYSTAKIRRSGQFGLNLGLSLNSLIQDIRRHSSGRTVGVKDLFVDLDKAKLLYTEANYKKALQVMLERSLIKVESSGQTMNSEQVVAPKDTVEIL